jgi:hypothetical protein
MVINFLIANQAGRELLIIVASRPLFLLAFSNACRACEKARFDLARPRPSAGMGLTIDHSRGTEGRHEPPVASGMFIAGF